MRAILYITMSAKNVKILTDCHVDEGIKLDQLMLAQTAEDGLARLGLWQAQPAFVISRRDSLRPGVRKAQDWAAQEGLSTAVRSSGGSIVLQGPGILSVALTHRETPAIDIDNSYQRFFDLVCDALSPELSGIVQQSVKGSFCDGRHNLAILCDNQVRKCAGTAQRRIHRRYPASMVHAVLLVACDEAHYIYQLNRFLAHYSSQHFNQDSTISITNALKIQGQPALSMQRITARIEQSFQQIIAKPN